MRLYFITLTTIAVLLILAVGGGVYGLSKSAIQQSKQQAMQATATGLATHLSAQINMLQQLVNTLAQSPSVVAALSSADANKLRETEEQLQQYVPNAFKIRLILPESPDQIRKPGPELSFADMEMVRTSFSGSSLPAIHETDSNQHLAISAKILKDNNAIGVLLASINFRPILQSLQTNTIEEGYFRVMQGDLQLMERGDSKLKESAAEQTPINNTAWHVLSHSGAAIDTHLLTLIAAFVMSTSLLMILFCYKIYRNFETLFIGDRGMILTAMKDLVNRQMHQTYPMNFKELKFVIETLYSLNQTYKRQPHPESEIEAETETNKTYLFTEETNDFFLSSPAVTISSPAEIIADTLHNADLEPINLVVSSNQAALDAIFNPGVIRGIVDKNLDNKMFYTLGCAFGSELKTQAIHELVLGYDGRLSSQSFAEAFAQGVITVGINVLNIGQVPISLVYFVAKQVEGKTGAMITGGHSPAHINGLKLMIQGELAQDKHLQTLKQRIMTENFIVETSGNISLAPRYNDEYLKSIVQDVLLLKPLKVVVDCGNGVTSAFAPTLLKTLGCEVIELFCEVNGTFPNHLPDPSKSENMSDLTAAVVYYHADLGIAFDGDGDRLGVIDSAGKMISPELIIQLFAKHILQTHPGASIVYNDKCSKQLGLYITQLGGKPIICKKKQSPLFFKDSGNQALFVGEMSGRMVFNDRWMGLDDALYAAARLLEILSAEVSDSKSVFNTLAHDAHKLSEEAIPS